MCWRTVTRALKQMDASFRRARRSCAKAPDAHREAVMKRALLKVRALAARGVCDLMHGDESGFCLVPPLPYLWQLKGHTLRLPAQSHRQRLNVLGFWKEEAQEEQALVHQEVVGPITGETFVQAVEERLLPYLRRPTVLLLDNAGLHRCALVQQKRKAWKAAGLHLWFLPAYCPHLNRIEVLWKRCKYHWLEPNAYAAFPSLCRTVSNVLQNVGSKYRLTFV